MNDRPLRLKKSREVNSKSKAQEIYIDVKILRLFVPIRNTTLAVALVYTSINVCN